MQPFTTLTAIAAPLLRENVDTDAIIPSREMQSTGRTGLAAGLFAGWRYRAIDAMGAIAGREPDPAFVLNRPEYAGARILLVGDNFGCGSSREHAVWALVEYGIRAIVAPGFAPIFRQNCVRNGLAPVVLAPAAIEALARAVEREPRATPVTVDLDALRVSAPHAGDYPFAMDEESRTTLRGGRDAIERTLAERAAIDAYVARDRDLRPWIYARADADAGAGAGGEAAR